METREYQVRFLIPAFLGNAEQNGQWRTPPFKALLRQWWRMAYAADQHFRVDVATMRREEGQLFGAAADRTGNRSRVRLRLSCWQVGKMDRWEQDPRVRHPEVGKGGAQIGSHLYLGYGPLNFNQGTYLGKKTGQTFKPHAAIRAGESAQLRLAFPAADAELLDAALSLIARYGTLGGRSRNGWGSFELDPKEGASEGANPPTRDWRDCLDRDWPHAIGRDDQGALIWRTEAFDDWKALMRRLAEIKIGLRTQFSFSSGNNAPQPEARHWLSHPVTKHNVKPWRQGRLPNSLRFKVRTDDDGKLRGVIFHVPCLPPPQFDPDRRAIEQVWQRVHGYLDRAALHRIPA